MLGVNKVLFLIVIHLFYSITCFQHINFLCSTPIWLSAVKIEVNIEEEEIEEEFSTRICNNEWKFSAHKQIKRRNDEKIDSDDNDNGGRLPFPHFDTKHIRKEFFTSSSSSSFVSCYFTKMITANFIRNFSNFGICWELLFVVSGNIYFESQR